MNNKQNSKNERQFRQGDVLIERVAKIEGGAKQKGGRVILAHGEVTGHCHEVEADKADAWKEREDTVAIRVKAPTKISHQEHNPIPLAKGNYKITRQREYTPQAIRRVAD